jgi:hypothetical protein
MISLPQTHLDPVFKAGKAPGNHFREFYATQVDVEHRGLQGGMASVEGDLMQIHVCPGHMGQAKMSRRMGRKWWETDPLCHLLHNLGPGHQSQGTSSIPMRLGQEEGTTLGGERSSVVHVRFQQAAGYLAIADDALSSILGMFGANPDLAIGDIKVTDLKGNQLFTTQGSSARLRNRFCHSKSEGSQGSLW